MDDMNVVTVNEGKIKKVANYTHKLREPFEYEGETYETLNFYFDDLTGKDFLNVEAEMGAEGEYAISPEVSRNLQYRLAARASNVASDVIANLPLYEFNIITNECRYFLLKLG
ncbi:phage tail assembly protein [Vallitalea guaymasensis]|uniref:phage tail assembly protein n=1 Tax=Vallitalea guaymasensis TaxID=1185412 RepID=UPI000DE4371D|nr:phage tail assembly protein [Vallitalea guaymasensis]